jgi:hypothetical protein
MPRPKTADPKTATLNVRVKPATKDRLQAHADRLTAGNISKLTGPALDALCNILDSQTTPPQEP